MVKKIMGNFPTSGEQMETWRALEDEATTHRGKLKGHSLYEYLVPGSGARGEPSPNQARRYARRIGGGRVSCQLSR